MPQNRCYRTHRKGALDIEHDVHQVLALPTRPGLVLVVPEWFADNVDTGCLAARGRTVVIGTEDGCVFLSTDAGEHWTTVAKGLASVRGVALG